MFDVGINVSNLIAIYDINIETPLLLLNAVAVIFARTVTDVIYISAILLMLFLCVMTTVVIENNNAVAPVFVCAANAVAVVHCYCYC